MKSEIEVKFYPVDKDKVRDSLKTLSAKCHLEESLLRIVMFGNTENKDMKVHYLRVRDEVNSVKLAAKIHAREGEAITDQKEREITVSSFDDTVEILKSAGLKTDYNQEKLREIWHYKGCEVVIDTYPGLDPLVEIEGDSEEMVKEVSVDLGFNWAERIITSITEIYGEKLGLDFDEALEHTKMLKF